MGTITEKFAYLKETKALIKSALIEKGQTVSDTDTFRSYADKILAIQGGGATTVDIIPEQELTFVYDESSNVYTLVGHNLFSVTSIALGKEYKVVWGSDEHSCTAVEGLFLGQYPMIGIGNPYVIGGENNNLPFAIGYITIPDDGDSQYSCIIASLDGSATKNVRVYQEASGGVQDEHVKYVTFIGGDGSVLYRMPVISGDNCRNPVTKGYISTPTKEDNAQYKDCTFAGWSLTEGGSVSSSALANVTEDRTVYAVFNATVQIYTVNFYDDDGTLLNTQILEYGATPSYNPLKDYHSFVGWNPSIMTVTGNADYYAIWEETAYLAEGTCGDNVSWYITDRYELVLTGTGSTYDYRVGGWASHNPSWSPWYTDHLELITSSITSITIGDGITRLGDGLFYYCRAATEISIPDSVTAFGIGTFSECRSVTSYVIPKGITSFPTRLFDCNVVLESLTIPNGVTSIGNQAFCACYLLRSINVPASVTYISNRGLSNFKSGDKANTGFASIVFEDTKSSWLLKESATATTTAKTIQGSELADPANAAKLFRHPEYESGCYGDYHWFKKS